MTAEKVQNYNLRHLSRDKICHFERQFGRDSVRLHDCGRHDTKRSGKSVQYERFCRKLQKQKRKRRKARPWQVGLLIGRTTEGTLGRCSSTVANRARSSDGGGVLIKLSS